MKTIIATTLWAASTFALAGQHLETTDSFTGVVAKRFTSTPENFTSQQMMVVVNYVAGELTLTAGPRRGVVDCRNSPMLLKTATGEIKRLQTYELSNKFCMAKVQPEWLKDQIQVRIPMWRAGPLYGAMDTSTLDIERLK